MLNVRAFAVLCSLLLAMVAWGYSSADDDAGQPVAALVASDFQLKAPFQEVRPRVRIAKEYTCYGDNLSPPLEWSGAPEGTLSFALIGDDIDHHTGTWAHWVLYNIPPTVTELTEGITTSTAELPDGTVQGLNDYKNVGYQGPCPLPTNISFWPWVGKEKASDGPHKYVFTLYALDTKVSLPSGANREQLMSEVEGHILAQTDTVGKFQVAPNTEMKQDFERTLHSDTPTPTGQ